MNCRVHRFRGALGELRCGQYFARRRVCYSGDRHISSGRRCTSAKLCHRQRDRYRIRSDCADLSNTCNLRRTQYLSNGRYSCAQRCCCHNFSSAAYLSGDLRETLCHPMAAYYYGRGNNDWNSAYNDRSATARNYYNLCSLRTGSRTRDCRCLRSRPACVRLSKK